MERIDVFRFECINLLLQQTAQFRVGARHLMIEPVCREHDRILLGVETQGGAEEPTERTGVLRLGVSKLDFDRQPVRAAQGAQDVEACGDARIGELVDGLDAWLMDFVAEARTPAIHSQGWRGAMDVKMQKAHKVSQRCSYVRRMLHQKAHQPEQWQAGSLPHQQSEVFAAGSAHAEIEQVDASCVGDQVVGVVKQPDVNPGLGAHGGRIRAQTPEDCRNRHRGADAHCPYVNPLVHR